MKVRTKAIWGLAIAFCFALICAAPAGAQTVTTGNIGGQITDGQGGVLPGATVTAVHAETGTSYEAVTGADGHFNILNVRVGVYTIFGSVVEGNDVIDQIAAVPVNDPRVGVPLELVTIDRIEISSRPGPVASDGSS